MTETEMTEGTERASTRRHGDTEIMKASIGARFSRSRLGFVSLALLFSGLYAFGYAQAPGSAPADRWPQFRGSAPLTGLSDAKLPDLLKVLWTYEAGDAIESSAAIADGVVYVGSQTGELHAVNLADGKAKWKYKASAD